MIWYGGATVSQANRRYLIPNHQGSIASIADGSGTTIAINRYDEYGIPASGNAGRFQYTGQSGCPNSACIITRPAYYSPTLGRFLQTDPVGYEDQFNLYAYVRNDPVNGTDQLVCINLGSVHSRLQNACFLLSMRIRPGDMELMISFDLSDKATRPEVMVRRSMIRLFER